jgi:hypothetical protein
MLHLKNRNKFYIKVDTLSNNAFLIIVTLIRHVLKSQTIHLYYLQY